MKRYRVTLTATVLESEEYEVLAENEAAARAMFPSAANHGDAGTPNATHFISVEQRDLRCVTELAD